MQTCCRIATRISSKPIVETVIDGIPKPSKLKLCGNEGQSDADWIKTLKDAVRQEWRSQCRWISAMRDQIVAAI